MSKGKIIVVAAGDDISMPNRVEKSVYNFLKYPSINTVSFIDEIIDSGDSNRLWAIPIHRREGNGRRGHRTLSQIIRRQTNHDIFGWLCGEQDLKRRRSASLVGGESDGRGDNDCGGLI